MRSLFCKTRRNADYDCDTEIAALAIGAGVILAIIVALGSFLL